MSLGQLEQQVMDLLWDRAEPLTANELRDQHIEQTPGAPEPAVTTVLTVLTRLTKKGFVLRQAGKRPHRFSAASTREEHTVELLNEVLGAVPDREAVLARFVGSIGPDEAAALRRALNSSSTA
ncbi:MAG: BlaI/MecI/CopY family transcriptional regulator [Micrococcaceae bacterium]